MPTLEQNEEIWDKNYDWSQGGDEWSGAWGSPLTHWTGTIYPRIRQFLPASHIVELAPGRGRWTQFLKDLCDKFTLVDLSSSCIDSCRERFKNESKINYHVNDGKSLPDEIEDGSVDFIFCYDSFVHCEIDVMDAYLVAIKRKLRAGGHAFIHHSNIGEYKGYFGPLSKLKRGRRFLERHGVIEPSHFRAQSVTAEKIRDAAHSHGITCIFQEIFPWKGNKRCIDAVSFFQNAEPTPGFETIVWRNPDHMKEAEILRKRAEYYPLNRE